MTPLLLIEDTPSLQLVYETVLRKAGHRVVSASTAADGLIAFRKHAPQVVLLDLMLPDRPGLELMREMMEERPDTSVIVITANGSINRAVEAMRLGAHDFLIKPFNDQRFLNAIEGALSGSLHERDAERGDANRGRATFSVFTGNSQAMETVFARIRSVGRSMATVFITGESGTGKELCAQAIHDSSLRASGPFVPINCGAIPSDLLESEVFGHLKGAFTGAIADKPGAAAVADGGTLFLDEICEMDMNLQTKLLRFLQTSMIQPVGATHPHKVDVRIICATNRDPMHEIRRRRFREDLYYRLHVVPIHLPPLRERGEDAVMIAEDALARFAAEEGRSFTAISDDVKALFRRLDWPGNVRELLNAVRHAVVLNDGPVLTSDMLPPELLRKSETGADGASCVPAEPPCAGRVLDGLAGKTLAEIERLAIERAVDRHGGSVPQAARELNVSPSTLYRKRETWAKDRKNDV